MNRGFCALLAVVCLQCLAGCSKGVLPPTAGGPGLPASPATPAGDVISTFTLVGHTDAGRKKWEIQGETADLMSEVVQLSPVRAISYGQTELHLSAQRGQFNKTTQNVHLEGDVVAVTSDGATLATQGMDWMQEQGEGSTPDWVRVTRPGMIAVGLGGLGYPKLKRVRLQRNVRVTLEDVKGKTVVTCDGPMEVDYARHKARFWNNVHVLDAKGLIQADRMDVALDPKTNQIEKATFWGHVKIYHGDQVAYANRVNYWQPLGQIRLLGHPKLLLVPKNE